MESLFAVTDQLVKLSDESKRAFAKKLHRLELPKGHVLIAENSICNQFYFIEKGLTRTFYYLDGRDITDWISMENSFAFSLISFITRQPDRRSIELLEPSVLLAMSYGDVELLCEKFHDIEHLFRSLISMGAVQVQQRFDDVHFVPAPERYRKLIQFSPSVVKRVPLSMIASFLGMSPENLSRIRAQL